MPFHCRKPDGLVSSSRRIKRRKVMLSRYPTRATSSMAVDAAGHPTIAARDEILAFFAARLRK
jgi:hypothetical protein